MSPNVSVNVFVDEDTRIEASGYGKSVWISIGYVSIFIEDENQLLDLAAAVDQVSHLLARVS